MPDCTLPFVPYCVTVTCVTVGDKRKGAIRQTLSLRDRAAHGAADCGEATENDVVNLPENGPRQGVKTQETAAQVWAPTPTRFRCACATPGQTLKKVSRDRTPIPPPQHRHPTMAGRATCSTGHVGKEDHTFLYTPEFLSYFLGQSEYRSTPQGVFFRRGGSPPGVAGVCRIAPFLLSPTVMSQ